MNRKPMRCLEDLRLGETFDCGTFRFTAAEIIAFAERFDPQPFHLDHALAEKSYFGRLVASGVHSQAAAIGLLVRATADVAVVAGGSLREARFLAAVLPDMDYAVSAAWTEARPSARNPARGVAVIAGVARDPDQRVVMHFGVTYIVARRTNHALSP